MKDLRNIKKEMLSTLQDYIIPFWLDRSIDKEYGGYITSFDEKGNFDGNGIKNIVTQSRMVWGFSYLSKYAKESDKERMREAAKEGEEYLMNEFWDKENEGGFFWLLNRDSSLLDGAKLTYGEGFGIYALSQYYLTYGDKKALRRAEECFDLLEEKVKDKKYGGYLENIERDWSPSPSGEYAGDRKSLDIHMHLLEAFTTLYKASGKEKHKRALLEVWNIIKKYMINAKEGYGLSQFTLSFECIPAINILRTWNAERETNEVISNPVDTTSYGHNIELSWLADEALRVAGERSREDDNLLIKLLDYGLKYGVDKEYGGVYRDGKVSGEVLVSDKEWWQNFESMTGFLNGYVMSKDERYLDAFISQWNFDKTYFMNYDVGESRQLLDRKGKALVSNMGNPWKGIYHTGRAFKECLDRIEILEEQK